MLDQNHTRKLRDQRIRLNEYELDTIVEALRIFKDKYVDTHPFGGYKISNFIQRLSVRGYKTRDRLEQTYTLEPSAE